MRSRPVVPIAINKSHLSIAQKQDRAYGEEMLKSGDDKIFAPTWLDKVAKKEFKRLAAELKKLDIICNVDIGGLAIACDAYSKYIMATKAINEQTIDAVMTRFQGSTSVKKSPISPVEKYAMIYRYYCSEYGLTPAARIKISASAHKKEDDFGNDPMAIYARNQGL